MYNTFTYNTAPFNALAGIIASLRKPTDPIILGQSDTAIVLRPDRGDTNITLDDDDDIKTIQL